MVLLVDEPAVARRDLGVVVVRGPDRLTYLHSLLSQHLEGAAAGTADDFLYLDAKGNAQAAGRALVRDEEVWLLTPTVVAAEFSAALDKFRFLLQVEVSDAGDRLAAASIRGPADVPDAPAVPLTFADDGEGLIVRDRSDGVDLVGPPAWLARRRAALGLPEAEPEAFEAWRVDAGVPAWGREITPGRRPQELGLLPTHVHLRKGCYPGQESIAKIYNLGRPRRALAVVDLSGPLSPGDTVTMAGKHGEVTSSAQVGDRWVCLALLPVAPDGSIPDDGHVAAGDTTGRVRRRVGEGLAQPGA